MEKLFLRLIYQKNNLWFWRNNPNKFYSNWSGEYTAEDVYSYLTGITIGSPEVKIFSARNTLIVVAEQIQICSKLPYFGGWYTIEEINGGVIQERIFYDVTTSCSFKEDHKESRIVCNEGYIVSGTSSRISTDNFRTCESITPEIEEIQRSWM